MVVMFQHANKQYVFCRDSRLELDQVCRGATSIRFSWCSSRTQMFHARPAVGSARQWDLVVRAWELNMAKRGETVPCDVSQITVKLSLEIKRVKGTRQMETAHVPCFTETTKRTKRN